MAKVTLNATVVDAKPTSLGVGEVVKFTNAKNKVEYYVGTATGGVSKPLTTVSKASDAVKTQVAAAEKIQTTALTTAHKIELAEIKQELKAKGIPTAKINSIIEAEKTANTAELKAVKGLLSPVGLQYATRAADNTFTTSTTPPATSLQSLLTYNDPVIAPTVKANIQQANDNVAKFQLTYGVTQPFYQTGKHTTTGVNPYAIYEAIDKGDKLVYNDTTKLYEPTPALAKYKGDQDGLMSGTDISKASARAIGLITNLETGIGSKANVDVDSKGNYIVRSAVTDADPYGKQNPLVDTGEKDLAGNPIYTMEARDDSKKNKVGVTSIYVQNPDNSFTYMGVADTSYQYVKSSVLKQIATVGAGVFMASVGVPWLAANLVAPMTGLAAGSVAATGVAGAISGAALAAASGQDILTGAALGGVGTAAFKALEIAATNAGGWGNLLDQVKAGDMTSFSTGVAQAKPIADAAITAGGGIDNLVAETATNVANTAGTNVADTTNLPNVSNNTNAGIDFSQVSPATLDNAGINLSGNIGAGGANLNLTTGTGAQLAQNALANTISNPSVSGLINSAPVTPATTGLDLLNNSQWANVGKPADGGLLDSIKDVGQSVLDYATANPLTTATFVGGTVIPGIANALTPTPKEPTYTAPLLVSGQTPSTGVTDWKQYYNNLFKREGVGAGQYLGYDLMNRLGDIPPELMGLLGTSAQATPTTTA